MDRDREQCIRCQGQGIVECDCQHDDYKAFSMLAGADFQCLACGETGEHLCPDCNGSKYKHE